jgi:hypothetical protein
MKNINIPFTKLYFVLIFIIVSLKISAGNAKTFRDSQSITIDYEASGKSLKSLDYGALMGIQVFGQLEKSAEEHYRKTGQKLKLVVLARSGTSSKNYKQLLDYNKEGELINYQQLLDSQVSILPLHPDFFTPGFRYQFTRDVLSSYVVQNSDANPYYDHLGFAVRDENEKSWFVYHALPTRKNKKLVPEVYKGGLGWFFANPTDFYSAQITYLPQDVQDRIYNLLLGTKSQIDSTLTDSYRTIVNYNQSSMYQNSISWALEVLAWSLSDSETYSRSEVIRSLKDEYVASKILLSGRPLAALQMAAMPLSKAFFPEENRIERGEQPNLSLGIIDTHSVASVNNYLEVKLGESRKN